MVWVLSVRFSLCEAGRDATAAGAARKYESGHREDRYGAPPDDGRPAAAHMGGDIACTPIVKPPECFAMVQEAQEFGALGHLVRLQLRQLLRFDRHAASAAALGH